MGKVVILWVDELGLDGVGVGDGVDEGLVFHCYGSVYEGAEHVAEGVVGCG